MDTARYWVALLTLATVAPFAPAWLLIHPLARFWRKVGPAVTYSAVLAVVAALASVLVLCRHWLLAVHWAAKWPLIATGLALIAASVAIAAARLRCLPLSVMIGVPEVSRKAPGRLLTEGIYSRIRHPRYVEIGVGLAGLALFTNYLAMYVLAAAYWPTIYVIVLLEERELKHRFGEAYEEYCRRVPRFIPGLKRGECARGRDAHPP
ncbi:MAG: methyltransferase family protein [Armatimonadota bacterium]